VCWLVANCQMPEQVLSLLTVTLEKAPSNSELLKDKGTRYSLSGSEYRIMKRWNGMCSSSLREKTGRPTILLGVLRLGTKPPMNRNGEQEPVLEGSKRYNRFVDGRGSACQALLGLRGGFYSFHSVHTVTGKTPLMHLVGHWFRGLVHAGSLVCTHQ